MLLYAMFLQTTEKNVKESLMFDELFHIGGNISAQFANQSAHAF